MVPSIRSHSPSSSLRRGMEREGTHLYSLPSALRNRSSSSTLESSNGSRFSSQSPEMPSVPLTSSSSRSSLAESSTMDHRSINIQDWSLLSIERVQDSSGMVLVALYHLASATLFTWPLQTDPTALQPKQGTVFIASRDGSDGDGNEQITSDSLRVLTSVLLTWMRTGAGRLKVKRKLGESEEDTDWLRNVLHMPRIRTAEKRAILDLQVVRPTVEWSEEKASRKGKEAVVLSSLDINATNRNHQNEDHRARSTLEVEKVPSIEITSPNTTDILSQRKAPWLSNRNPSYVH